MGCTIAVRRPREIGCTSYNSLKSQYTPRVRRVLREAFPDCDAVFGGHGDYGGHRTPRDHTISDDLRAMVGRSTGKRR